MYVNYGGMWALKVNRMGSKCTQEMSLELISMQEETVNFQMMQKYCLKVIENTS